MSGPPRRILNLEPDGYAPQARAILDTLGTVTDGPMTRAALGAEIGHYDAVIVRLGHRLDAEILAKAVRLKAIVSATTGLTHIDLDRAKAQGIAVLSLQGERAFLDTVFATAEHTWGLLLALLRHIPASSRSVQSGDWNRDRFKGRELNGKTLGILGCGRLGSKVAGYGAAFGMEVLVADIRPVDLSVFGGKVRQVPAEELYARADILSLHIPYDQSTHRRIGAQAFAAMKTGAVLVNTARGEVVDETALLDALRSGKLAAAALDVLSGENSGDPHWRETDPLIAWAREHPNLLITPHLGGATAESMEKTEIFMAEKFQRFVLESAAQSAQSAAQATPPRPAREST